MQVTQAYLPPFEEYAVYLKQIWESHWLTNDGPILKKLEAELRDYLRMPHVQFVGNGTIALQLAIEALQLNGEIITTPFSYVATSNSILWQKHTPVFCDILESDFCIDPSKIEALITPKTTAIMAVHVYGHPCDLNAISEIGKRHNLRVVYDAAHAFGVEVGGKSIAAYGDISTFSFHATKVFHTVEGGAVVCADDGVADKISLGRAFGHRVDDYYSVGINGKNSEFHAAMGLALLPKLNDFISKRKTLCDAYDELLLPSDLRRPVSKIEHDFNYAYYPIVFPNEQQLLAVLASLRGNDIFPRRYFYPSLNTLSFFKGERCSTSESLSKRVLCLPLHTQLEMSDIERVARVIRQSM